MSDERDVGVDVSVEPEVQSDAQVIIDETPLEVERKGVIKVPLSELHPFRHHPFRTDGADVSKEIDKIAEGVAKVGDVTTPALVRPLQQGGYEIISGHRRKLACERAGLTEMSVEVIECDDDTATILMVNSNIQRKNLTLPEKIKAFAQMYQAETHQGKAKGAESGQTTRDKIGKIAGVSGATVGRWVRLYRLNDKLLAKIGSKQLPASAGDDLANLSKEVQGWIVKLLENKEIDRVSLKQAKELDAEKDTLTTERVKEILSTPDVEPVKKATKVTISLDRLSEYLGGETDPEKIVEIIIDSLEKTKKI